MLHNSTSEFTKVGFSLAKAWRNEIGGTGGSLLGTAAITGFPAYDFVSGNESLGGAVGRGVGGMYGWHLGERLFDKLLPDTAPVNVAVQDAIDSILTKTKVRKPSLEPSGLSKALTSGRARTVGRFGSAMLMSMLLDGVGRSIGESLLPIRREKKQPEPAKQYPASLSVRY